MEKNNHENEQTDKAAGERIAKFIAGAGICSRRDAERLIEEGRVAVNGEKITTPALKVTADDKVEVDGKPLDNGKPQTRLWLYHKPRGLLVTNRDSQGRQTIYEHLPKTLPRVISVGRLDMNSEGLLLLTNDGEFSRYLELPATGLDRQYRVRAFGDITQKRLDALKNGVTVEGVKYGAIKAVLASCQGDNSWIDMTLHEGKNREIRRVLEHLGLQVSRLIRISYGGFELGDLKEGAVKEVKSQLLQEHLKKFR